MASSSYMTGRKRYQRPQGILWSNNAGTLSNGLYVPNGYEVGTDVPIGTAQSLIDQFIVLSDHNRSEMQFTNQRIEQRQRTINGRMRSYHIADKVSFSVAWQNLPSRAYHQTALFDDQTGVSPYKGDTNEYTADGGAGGVEILKWYQEHQGPFWMYLAYDRYDNFGPTEENSEAAYGHLNQYNEIIEVYFSSFDYSVIKRGQGNFDLWNISVTLEEV